MHLDLDLSSKRFLVNEKLGKSNDITRTISRHHQDDPRIDDSIVNFNLTERCLGDKFPVRSEIYFPVSCRVI